VSFAADWALGKKVGKTSGNFHLFNFDKVEFLVQRQKHRWQAYSKIFIIAARDKTTGLIFWDKSNCGRQCSLQEIKDLGIGIHLSNIDGGRGDITRWECLVHRNMPNAQTLAIFRIDGRNYLLDSLGEIEACTFYEFLNFTDMERPCPKHRFHFIELPMPCDDLRKARRSLLPDGDYHPKNLIIANYIAVARPNLEIAAIPDEVFTLAQFQPVPLGFKLPPRLCKEIKEHPSSEVDTSAWSLMTQDRANQYFRARKKWLQAYEQISYTHSFQNQIGTNIDYEDIALFEGHTYIKGKGFNSPLATGEWWYELQRRQMDPSYW
jgi:hypothetical protein